MGAPVWKRRLLVLVHCRTKWLSVLPANEHRGFYTERSGCWPIQQNLRHLVLKDYQRRAGCVQTLGQAAHSDRASMILPVNAPRKYAALRCGRMMVQLSRDLLDLPVGCGRG